MCGAMRLAQTWLYDAVTAPVERAQCQGYTRAPASIQLHQPLPAKPSVQACQPGSTVILTGQFCLQPP